MEGGGQLHSTMWNVHPPSNYDNVVDQVIQDQGVPNRVPN